MLFFSLKKDYTYRMKYRKGVFIVMVIIGMSGSARGEVCTPTMPDALGPFYEPGAPVRERVGEGYVMRGRVKSAGDCRPIAGAKIEFWLTGPQGAYDDDHRATVFSGADGSYRFESNLPHAYYNRPPHIHLRVSADGYYSLITQHYPAAGVTDAVFDLVLIPLQ